MQYGITYIVRPRMQPAKHSVICAFASAGASQLLFGPASLLVVRADEGQMLDACDVLGIGAVQVAARIVLLVELEQRAAVEHLLDELAVFLLGAFAPVEFDRDS